MTTEYLHGAYGHLDESIVQDVVASETVPVYFGTAPLGLVRGWGDMDAVNVPVKLSSLSEALTKVGYCSDFANYTLCEAIAAHFDSGSDGVGPIFVVNVLDPSVHRSDEEVVRDVAVARGRAAIQTSSAILDTVRVIREDIDASELQETKVRDDDPAYTQALSESGVSFVDGVISWDGSPIDPSLVHEGIAYVGINYVPPAGATGCTVRVDGELLSEVSDFSQQSDSVSGGMPVDYFPFATADGNSDAYGSRVYEVVIEWHGGESDGKTTRCRIGRNTLDYIEGVDYGIDYDVTSEKIILTSVDGRVPDGSAKVAYFEADPEKVTAEDIVGTVTSDGVLSGIEAVPLVYQENFAVPNILAAPGWSHEKSVYDALVSHCASINGHWDAIAAVDLPLVDQDGVMVDTIEKAIAWKDENAYSSERAVACWPMATDASGRQFHVSTLFVAESLRVDQENGGIPFETPSNKPAAIAKQYFGENSRNRGFDQQTANGLNEHGITTVVGWAGEWVLWGSHTAAYEFGDPSVDPRSIFATSVRMLLHITNSFQAEWSDEIDSPMTRALRDRIVNREQEKLDSLVTVGALIGSPRVYFCESQNPTSNLIEGDFRWDIAVTPTSPLKSASAYVSYTDAGFASFLEGGN